MLIVYMIPHLLHCFMNLDQLKVQAKTMVECDEKGKTNDINKFINGLKKYIDLLPYVGIDPTHNALVYKAIRSEDDDFSMRMSLLNK
jgi:hypothetical protein